MTGTATGALTWLSRRGGCMVKHKKAHRLSSCAAHIECGRHLAIRHLLAAAPAEGTAYRGP